MWGEVADRLAPTVFYQHAHRLVFQVIKELTERGQYSDRPIVPVIDECHLFTVNPLLK